LSGKDGNVVHGVYWPEVDRNGNPRNDSYPNAMAALKAMGVEFSYNAFRHRAYVKADWLGEGPVYLDDALGSGCAARLSSGLAMTQRRRMPGKLR
jgi:hypothetical protein